MPKTTLKTGLAFDAGLATLAAISAGFVAFAMPEPSFSALVTATPLPGLVAAAQPPLGETARLAAVAATALFVFASVWALLYVLGRKPRPVAVLEPVAEDEPVRLRRADAHPDAPRLSPLMAARDLGEPAEERAVAAPAPVETARPLPAFLVPEAPVVEHEAEPEPLLLDEPEPEPVATSEPVPLSDLAARIPEPMALDSDQPIADMLGRIEFGLKKRRAIPAPPPSEDLPETEKVGHRLRSAITDLQKMAGNG